MILENSPEEEIDEVMDFMVEIGLPRLGPIGRSYQREYFCHRFQDSSKSLIHHEPFKITGELVY